MNAAVFTTITGIIVAHAAILAYLLQRARYLREIEPDVELTWTNRFEGIQFKQSLDNFWCFYIPVKVENKSKNHAKDLTFNVELLVFPRRERPNFVKPKYYPLNFNRNLYARRTEEELVYIGLNFVPDLVDELQPWSSSLDIENAGFDVTIKLEYFSNRELLLFLVQPPWHFGIERYKRELRLRFYFDKISKKGKISYLPIIWSHPEENLPITKAVVKNKNQNNHSQ